MKTTAKNTRLAMLASTLALAPFYVAYAGDNDAVPTADTSAPAPVISASPAPAPAKLPYGVEDVLKLSRAQVGEDVILNYVRSSGTIYNLTPRDIVYLRDQGVSERVLNAMLDQRKRVEMASQAQPQPVPAPTGADGSTATAPVNQNPPQTQAAPVYTDPNANATYAEAPLTPPASSVYVIPYSGAYYSPYYYPCYPYYYGWYGPSISLGFRFGGHGWYGGHGYYGGHYGGHFGGRSFAGHGGGGHFGHR